MAANQRTPKWQEQLTAVRTGVTDVVVIVVLLAILTLIVALSATLVLNLGSLGATASAVIREFPARVQDRVDPPANEQSATKLHPWELLGRDGQRIIRTASRGSQCPQATVDGRPTNMNERRPQSPDQFSVSVCEIAVEPGEDVRFESGWRFPPLPQRFDRIVVLGDTGCRLTHYESQACNNWEEWPFAQIASLAASKEPDLVIHVGDYHYREKPCPRSKDCQDAAWGDTWEVWSRDFFEPAEPLLNKTPWVFVRGNHEDCKRAGAGWLHFFEPALRPENNENCYDFVDPYTLRLEPAHDLLVFDNSAEDPRPFKLRKQMGLDDWLNSRWGKVRSTGHESDSHAQIALMHKPLADYRPPEKPDQFLSATEDVLESRWRPSTVFSGHSHSFQSVQHGNGFRQIVIGNGGTSIDKKKWPKEIVEDDRMTCHSGSKSYECSTGSWRGEDAEHIAVGHDFGFLVLDLIDRAGWFGRVYNLENNIVAVCALPFEQESDGGLSNDMQPFADYAKDVGLPNATKTINDGGLTGRGCAIVTPADEVTTAGTL
jgi:hypothetical protein